ncbi:hypothetical protein DFJ73DRAFT_857281 [Zopfochytrium polystomum]|nr:hypothetical protein DFJ73DRAFT_857281 [Zopfochytrium polystomum]
MTSSPPVEVLQLVYQTSLAGSVAVLHSFVDSKGEWRVRLLLDSRIYSASPATEISSRDEITLFEYKNNFLDGIAKGELFIPPASVDPEKLQLKIFPNGPESHKQTHWLRRPLQRSREAEVAEFADWVRAQALLLQRVGATGRVITQSGQPSAASEPSALLSGDLMAELEALRREKKEWRTSLSAQAVLGGSMNPAPLRASVGSGGTAATSRKRIVEKSLLNPRQKLRESKQAAFVSDDEGDTEDE